MRSRTPGQHSCRRAPQTGFTIVELMIGITIGLLGVLGMISLYLAMARQVEGTPSEPGLRQRSQQDGQIALAIISLQYDLQRAGFGIETPTLNTDLISTGTPINSLGWRWVNSTPTGDVTECAAMRYRATTNAGATNETGIIEIIPLVSPCTSPDPTVLFANTTLVVQTVATNVPKLQITLAPKTPSCYIGADTTTPGLSITLQTRLSLGGLQTGAQFCNFNITD
jgi:Tfp pilus assembly protein PilW